MSGPIAKAAKTARVVALAFASVALAGCVSIYREHGYIPPEEQLAALRVGVDTRSSVVEAVGSPTAGGVLRDSGMYYITSRVRHYGAREPEIVSREMVAISFDSRGVVRNIERFGLEDGRVVTLQRRVTETGVEDRTFIQQLLGNLGRIGPGAVLGN